MDKKVDLKKVIKFALNGLDDFKNQQKTVWSNAIWYVKVRIFWKCMQYIIHWDET